MTPINDSEFGEMKADIRHIRNQLEIMCDDFKEHLSQCDSRHLRDGSDFSSFRKEVAEEFAKLRVEIAIIKTRAVVIATIAGAAPVVLSWLAIVTKLIKL